MNVLALVKNSERYVFLYDDNSTESILQKLGEYAADQDLSFSWYDAAVLSQKVRRLKEELKDEASVVASPASSEQSATTATNPHGLAESQPPQPGSPAPNSQPTQVPLPGLRFRGSGPRP